MASELNFKQELVGVLGKPVAENPTQPMMEAAFRHHDLAWRYLTLEVDPKDLGNAILGMRAMGFPRWQLHDPPIKSPSSNTSIVSESRLRSWGR